jgi:hypothetical protein
VNEKVECQTGVNYTDVTTPFTNAILAYNNFLAALDKTLPNKTSGPGRFKVFSDDPVLLAVTDFDTNVEMAANSSRIATSAGNAVVDCQNGAIGALESKLTCYAAIMTEVLMLDAGVAGEFHAVKAEFNATDPKSPEFPEIRVHLRNVKSRKTEMSYRISYVESEKQRLKHTMNDIAAQRDVAKTQLAKLQNLDSKLSSLTQHVAYISRPSSLWNYYSVKNLLDVEELFLPMKEVASLIRSFTGQTSISYGLKALSNERLDALKHKFLQDN